MYLTFKCESNNILVKHGIVAESAQTRQVVEGHQEASVQLRASCSVGKAALSHPALHHWRRTQNTHALYSHARHSIMS